MSVFLQFLTDYLWLVILVGVAIVGMIAIGAILIVNAVRERRKRKALADDCRTVDAKPK